MKIEMKKSKVKMNKPISWHVNTRFKQNTYV